MSEQVPETADSRRAAVEAEYGRYVARSDIYIGGALAFRAGDPVPVSHVDRGVVAKDSVVGANTKTAETLKQES